MVRLYLKTALCLALVGSATARPVPQPWNLGNWLKDTAKNVGNAVKEVFKPPPSAPNIRTCNDAQLKDIAYYVEYAAAAYCDPNHIPGTEVQCPNNICPTITNRKVTTIIEFANGDADTTGLVARDDTTRTIVVAFRGSRSVRNWLANFAATPKSLDWCYGCKIHKGFYDAYMDERNVIRKAVIDLKKKYPDYKISTVGHSLGGALAQICATDLRMSGYQVTAYTFGSPRIGNDKLATFMANGGTNYRITHLDDPVPRLPLLLMGYSHIAPEYHIFQGDSPINPFDVRILDNEAYKVASANVSAHLRYFLTERISDCATGLFEFKL